MQTLLTYSLPFLVPVLALILLNLVFFHVLAFRHRNKELLHRRDTL